jgi:hypothetical protein
MYCNFTNALHMHAQVPLQGTDVVEVTVVRGGALEIEVMLIEEE